jgi:RNA polymerase sigma-70 factor, ECF subfamily
MESENLAINLGGEYAIPLPSKVRNRSAEPLSDEEIISKIEDGDIEAFGILVKKYENFVYTLVRGLLHLEEPARDVSQEVFLRAYRALRRFEKKASFKTWLYRIAYNTAMNYVKMNKIQFQPISDLANAAPVEAVDIPLKITVRKLIAGLKPDHRAIIILHYFEGLKYEEIAEVLECPVGTVKIRLYRAKLELKELWEKYAT